MCKQQTPSGPQHYPAILFLSGKAGKEEELMIEKFFTQSQTLFRMRVGSLGPYLPVIATSLDEAHYFDR